MLFKIQKFRIISFPQIFPCKYSNKYLYICNDEILVDIFFASEPQKGELTSDGSNVMEV